MGRCLARQDHRGRVYLTSDDVDSSTPPPCTVTAGGLASDRRALSRRRTGLLWRTHIGRIVASVLAASRATRCSPQIVKEKDRGRHRTVPGRDEPSLVPAQGCRGGSGSHRRRSSAGPSVAGLRRWWPHQG